MQDVAFVFVTVLGFSEKLSLSSCYIASGIKTTVGPKDPGLTPPGAGLLFFCLALW